MRISKPSPEPCGPTDLAPPPSDTEAPAVRSTAKRAVDILCSAAALVLFSPLLLLIALVVVVESGRPAFFLQRRTGLYGRPFRIIKFRTMTVLEDGASLAHATRQDTRVTAVGAFLRKSHWDELPQLLNVLKGDMALIGPRPHALAHDQFYASLFPHYTSRFRVRPGLTGLAQVEGFRGEVRSLECMRARVEADNRYVQAWSMRMDMVIALRTLPLLVHDDKSY